MGKNLNDLFGRKPAPSVELELKVVGSEPLSPILSSQVPNSWKGTTTGRIQAAVPNLDEAPPRIDGAKRDRLAADIRSVEKKLAIRQGKKEQITSDRDAAVMKRFTAQQELDINDLVQILLQKTSDFARQQAKTRIEAIVTSALTVIFGKDYTFKLNLEVRSNRPELDYYIESEGLVTQLKPPDYDRGGGIADVVSLALRLAVAELAGVTGTLWLDEVGKHVSADFAPNVAYFLKEYSHTFGRQIVLITHAAALAEVGDHSLSVSQKNGVSEVKVL